MGGGGEREEGEKERGRARERGKERGGEIDLTLHLCTHALTQHPCTAHMHSHNIHVHMHSHNTCARKHSLLGGHQRGGRYQIVHFDRLKPCMKQSTEADVHPTRLGELPSSEELNTWGRESKWLLQQWDSLVLDKGLLWRKDLEDANKSQTVDGIH